MQGCGSHSEGVYNHDWKSFRLKILKMSLIELPTPLESLLHVPEM